MSPKKVLTRAREQFAWDMRCRGYGERRIAEEIVKKPSSCGSLRNPQGPRSNRGGVDHGQEDVESHRGRIHALAADYLAGVTEEA